MEESVIATFDDVKFIEGVTKMTQANWQKYFGTILPNGVYEGLNQKNKPTYGGVNTYELNDGIVLANGILASIETENGYTEFPKIYSGMMDRFICARVHFLEETVELIQKADVSGASLSDTDETIDAKFFSTMMEFSHDESYCCERNTSFWDIPLLYQTKDRTSGGYYYWLGDGVDLSRNVRLDGSGVQKETDLGGRTYVLHKKDIVDIENNTNYAQDTVVSTLYFDPIDRPDGCIFYFNNIETFQRSYKIKINKNPYFFFDYGQQAHNVDANYKFSYVFSNPDNWTNSTNEYESAVSKKTWGLRFTCYDVDYTSGIKCNYKILVEEL